jgi:hypothetical protein
LRSIDLNGTSLFKQFQKLAESLKFNGNFPPQVLLFERDVVRFIHWEFLPALKRLESFIMIEYRQVLIS